MAAPPNPSSADRSRRVFTVGTRSSKLALMQTDMVVAELKKVCPEYEFKIHSRETAGDRSMIALRDFTTKNLWTEELEELLIKGDVDIIVHSLKDVPTLLPAGCTLGPTLEREDSRDVLVMKQGSTASSLEELPAGSVVGTSSIRRTAQLARLYPRLKVMDVRGNIGTRLAKLDAEDGPYSCLILAAAGLLRLDLGDRITKYLDSKNGGMLYAVGQGALGIEIRKEDEALHLMLSKIGHNETTFAVLAERSLLRTLEGGCSAPLGVETEWVHTVEGLKKLRMRAIVVSVDGSEIAEVEVDGDVDSNETAERFGITVANALVAEGAGKILEAIERTKRASS
ncbi:hypothetical protein ASPZODRAFT_162818 [Penicilliopsis zonata CBS 506.65]|uniref:Porphobilinogen deaminase n=1 Tax=Penicilliopsis zonata CBS 506.65 TaxID=1073090 RepID=A0A1L9SUM4_9EURO|nr:hypothetical protein ASPZODRAFT_162818 [Penicilliopsis zonata CBS 506.65]OJJ50925.1 hypothetical protein ASPZODRAFT_162818 [Penicilliopsis zonata CBS 506.65]